MQTATKWRDDAAAEADHGFVSLLLEGSRYLQEGDVARARTSLEQALRVRPQNEKARNLLGQTYFRMGLFDAAIRVYSRLSQEYPDEPTLRLNLALVHLKKGDLASARAELEQVVRLDPNHAKGLSYLGLVYERLNELPLARWAFQQAGSDKLVAHVEAKMRTKGMALDNALVPPWLVVQPEEETGPEEENTSPAEVQRTIEAVEAPAPPPAPSVAVTPVRSATPTRLVSVPTLRKTDEDSAEVSGELSGKEPTGPTDDLQRQTDPSSSDTQVAPPPQPSLIMRRKVLEHPPRLRKVEVVRPVVAPPPAQASIAAITVVTLAVKWAQAARDPLPLPDPFPIPIVPPEASDSPTIQMPALESRTHVMEAIGGPPPSAIEVTQEIPQPSLPPLPPAQPEPKSFGTALPRLMSVMAAETAGARPGPDEPVTRPPDSGWSPGGSANESMIMQLSGDAMSGEQWLQKKSLPPVVRPFSPVGPGLLGLAVTGPVLVRAVTLAAVQGDVDTQPAYRKGSAGQQLMGSDEDPFVLCTGSGSVTLDPGQHRVSVMKVDGTEVTVLDSALFGASAGVEREEVWLKLATDGEPVAATRFTGSGVVAVRATTSVRAVPCEPAVPLRVSLDHLLAWEGPLGCKPAPGVSGLPKLQLPKAAVLLGKGVVLLKAGVR